MKYTLIRSEETTLAAFAEKHGLEMVVNDRGSACKNQSVRYYASFRGCWVREKSTVHGIYGDGATPGAAIAHYLLQISGKTLATDLGDSSKDISVPHLTSVD